MNANQVPKKASASSYKKWISATFLALWLGFVFTNSLRSRISSAKQSQDLTTLTVKMLAFFGIDVSRDATHYVRKAAHITEFLVLTLLVCITVYLFGVALKKSAAIAGGGALLCAITDEILQIFSHRGPAVTDVLIDSIGIALALGIVLLFRHKLSAE